MLKIIYLDTVLLECLHGYTKYIFSMIREEFLRENWLPQMVRDETDLFNICRLVFNN